MHLFLTNGLRIPLPSCILNSHCKRPSKASIGRLTCRLLTLNNTKSIQHLRTDFRQLDGIFP